MVRATHATLLLIGFNMVPHQNLRSSIIRPSPSVMESTPRSVDDEATEPAKLVVFSVVTILVDSACRGLDLRVRLIVNVTLTD